MDELDRWILQQVLDPKLWARAILAVAFAWAILVLVLA